MPEKERRLMGIRIIYHADDFAANREISENILDCCRSGAMNSLSVLPNSPYLDECMALLKPYRDRLDISIHFNLAEGSCLSDPAQVPLLTDAGGMFRISFFKVLFLSLFGTSAKKRELQRQLDLEMRAQLERMLPYVETLRIDSHQHYHMIPAVLRSILSAAEEAGADGGRGVGSGKNTGADSRKIAEADRAWAIEFIRIPAEPLAPFLRHPSLFLTYRPINLVKNIVLNMLNIMDHGLLAPYRKRSAVFFGILLSGGMDLTRVSRLLPDFQKIAKRRGLPLEILCHPGGAESAEGLMDAQNRDCAAFYLSGDRKKEKEMLMKIRQREGKSFE